MDRSKIIAILGPTSSGKSEVAIRLAQKFNGEIISADSRQVYRHMNIGTGKVPRDSSSPRMGRGIKGEGLIKKIYYSAGIPHYLIDIISPRTEYNVSKFKKDADKIIADILSRGKLPIICGGTGFWIKAVVDNVVFPEVKPDKVLREKLQVKSSEKLFEMLQKMDSERAKTIDKNNKVRLIRAIEICKALGSVPPLCHCERSEAIPQQSSTRLPRSLHSLAMTEAYNFLQIGIDISKEKLHQNIQKRLKKRFRAGMIEEVENLKNKYELSWKKIQSFGLGYFWIPLYLQEKKACPVKSRSEAKSRQDELFNRIYSAEKDYAKRQMTWFRKDIRIKWLKNYKDIQKEVLVFLKNKGAQKSLAP